MKRKTKSPVFYRNRFILNNIAFDFTSETYHHSIKGVTIKGVTHYKFKFATPLCPNTFLATTHLPSKRQDICLNLTTNKCIQNDKYYVYPTHAISIDMTCLYIALENINLCGYDNQDNIKIYRPIFDFGIDFFNGFNYKRLKYIAPDEILGVDSSIISQNNPLWTKRAGAITSSSVQKYLGYFVSKPYDIIYDSDHNVVGKKETSWKLFTKTLFVGFLGARVRFGNMKENEVILAYMNQFPDRIFKQTGYTAHPERPTQWGASPDGVIVNKNDNVERIIEIKSSMSADSCSFQGYYIPQVLWEMECLGVDKGDLIRYCEKKKNTNGLPTITCRIATIIQDDNLQDEIKKLIQASKKVEKSGNSLEFKTLVWSQEYVDMRKKLDNMALKLDYQELKIPIDQINEMNKYMKDIYQTSIPDEMSGHPLMKNIQKRHMEIYQMVNNNDKDKRQKISDLVFEQIKDYVSLTKE